MATVITTAPPAPPLPPCPAQAAFRELLVQPKPSVGERLLAARAIHGPTLTPVGDSSSEAEIARFLTRPRASAAARAGELVVAARALPVRFAEFLAICAGTEESAEPGALASPSPAAPRGAAVPAVPKVKPLRVHRAWFVAQAAKLLSASAALARRTQVLLVVEPARAHLGAALSRLADEVTRRHAGIHSVTLDARTRTATVEPVLWAAARRWSRYAQTRSLLAEVSETEPRAPGVDELLDPAFEFTDKWSEDPVWDRLGLQSWTLDTRVDRAVAEMDAALAGDRLGVATLSAAAKSLPEVSLERDAWYDGVAASLDPLVAREFGTSTPSGQAWATVSRGQSAFRLVDPAGRPWGVVDAAATGGSASSAAPPSPGFDQMMKGLQQISDRSSSAIAAGFAGMAPQPFSAPPLSPAQSPTSALVSGAGTVAPPAFSPAPKSKKKKSSRGKSKSAAAAGGATAASLGAVALKGSSLFVSRDCVTCAKAYAPSDAAQRRCTVCSAGIRADRLAMRSGQAGGWSPLAASGGNSTKSPAGAPSRPTTAQTAAASANP
jgi:hypothetical protein